MNGYVEAWLCCRRLVEWHLLRVIHYSLLWSMHCVLEVLYYRLLLNKENLIAKMLTHGYRSRSGERLHQFSFD